jgi:hypothetical protein
MLLFINLIIKFYWKKYLISLNVGVPSTTLDHIRRQKCKNDLSNSLESEICLISLEIEIIFFVAVENDICLRWCQKLFHLYCSPSNTQKQFFSWLKISYFYFFSTKKNPYTTLSYSFNCIRVFNKYFVNFHFFSQIFLHF